MARLVMMQQHQQHRLPSFSPLPSLSDFIGTKLQTQLHYRRKVSLPKETLHVTVSNAKKTLAVSLTKQLSSESKKGGTDFSSKTKDFAVPRRNAMALMLSGCIFSQVSLQTPPFVVQSVALRDPYNLDENLAVDMSSPSSSNYKSVEDLGPPEVAGQQVPRHYLTEFMSTRLGVKREGKVLSTSSRVADDGKLYYQVEVNIKSYASNNELAVMPKDHVVIMEWNMRYLTVLGVENNQLYALRLQTSENVFVEEESDLHRVMESF